MKDFLLFDSLNVEVVLKMNVKLVYFLLIILISLTGCSKGYIGNDNKSFGSLPVESNSNVISAQEARNIALAHVGLDEDAAVVFSKCNVDYDDNHSFYEIEFYYDNVKYEFDIGINDGNVYGFESEALRGNDLLNEEEIISIALNEVKGATRENIVEQKLDMDDGITLYEFKIIYDGFEYEISIDAYTNRVIEFSKERLLF